MNLQDESTSDENEDKKLTQREFEVLKLVVEGKSNRDIATILIITHHTAKAHVSSILKKFGCKSRVEAVIYALRSHIL